MGAGGVPNRTVIKVIGVRGDLPVKGAKPNSRYDLHVDGEKVQSRWFDAFGNVVRNRDYFHQDAHNNHTFPHDHVWEWVEGVPHRNPENFEPDGSYN